MLNNSFHIAGALTLMLLANASLADTVINNYGTGNNQPEQSAQANQPQQNQPPSNVDPRVPPAGSYSTTNSDGSSEQLYTTGQKQPFYVDNPAQNTTPTQVFVQPTMPTPSPAPTTTTPIPSPARR